MISISNLEMKATRSTFKIVSSINTLIIIHSVTPDRNDSLCINRKRFGSDY